MRNSGVAIRRASTTDAILLAELGRSAFLEAFTGSIRDEDLRSHTSTRFGPAQQASELADPQSTFLVAEIESTAIGYAKLRHGETPSCVAGRKPVELERLYLTRRHVGRGAGSLLMRACLDEAARNDHDVMWLDVWEKNESARRFYERYDFIEVGSRPYIVGNDVQTHILMMLELPARSPAVRLSVRCATRRGR